MHTMNLRRTSQAPRLGGEIAQGGTGDQPKIGWASERALLWMCTPWAGAPAL